MFLPEKDDVLQRGGYMYCDEYDSLAKLEFTENEEDASEYNYSANVYIYTKNNDSFAGGVVIIPAGISLDGMEIEYITLGFEQDGEDNEDDYHYSYGLLKVCFDNGDTKEIKYPPLPVKNLMTAVKIVFRRILKLCDA